MKSPVRFYFYKALMLTAVSAAVVSCSEDTVTTLTGASKMEPTLIVNQEVNTVRGVVASGLVNPVPAAADLSLRVTSSDGRYGKVWASAADYPVSEPLRPGAYTVEAYYGSEYEEGFDSPYFYGSASVDLADGITLPVEVECKLANTMFNVEYTSDFCSYFKAAEAVLHAEGGSYVAYPREQSKMLYVNPGEVSVMLYLTLTDGREVNFRAAEIGKTLPGTLYTVTLDIDVAAENPTVVVSFDEQISTDDIRIELTPEFITSGGASIAAVGFTPGTTLRVAEGVAPAESVAMEVTAADLANLVLTTRAASLQQQGWPAEIDLVKADASQISHLTGLGLKLTGSGSSITKVDFTDVLARLRSSSDNSGTQFSLIATTAGGQISDPLTLSVGLDTPDFTVLNVSDAVAGVDMVRIELLAPAADLEKNLTVQTRDDSGRWVDAEIVSIEPAAEAGAYGLTIKLPANGASSADVRLVYCGEQKADFTVEKVSPQYSLTVDAFAHLAMIRIEAEDSEMEKLLISIVDLYVNGTRETLVTRSPEKGYLLIGGLSPNTEYSLTTTVFNPPVSDNLMSAPVAFVTEDVLSLPNGGFDQVKISALKYTNLPSGGRYSQNIVDIFNQQNYQSYDLSVPKEWANTNTKTFNKAATNHNTWYMQPSVYTTTDCFEEPYAVVLQTTAFDLHGEPIPDYRQQSEPYIPYSRNIPAIAHRAAAKVFLGEYGFNPATGEEVYVEGVEFTSRPSAINGYYKYIPSTADMTDRGLVNIELIGINSGAEVVIGRGTMQLSPVSSYTAFSLPVDYNAVGIKAVKLKLMIASSVHVGSIEEESQSILTFSNPVTSTSLGGCLYIDGLTLSY